jgi:hypothetical protein
MHSGVKNKWAKNDLIRVRFDFTSIILQRGLPTKKYEQDDEIIAG